VRDVLPRTPELPPVPGGSSPAGARSAGAGATFGGSAAEFPLLGFAGSAGDFLPTCQAGSAGFPGPRASRNPMSSL
jgi:hypothetical protein